MKKSKLILRLEHDKKWYGEEYYNEQINNINYLKSRGYTENSISKMSGTTRNNWVTTLKNHPNWQSIPEIHNKKPIKR